MRHRFLLFLIIALCFAHNAVATEAIFKGVPNASVVGRGVLTYVFWDVYEATLYAPQGQWDPDKPYALSIKYYREINGKDIADRSIQEIRKQGFTDEVRLAAWNAQLKTIFPDVKDGSVLSAIYRPGKETIFYNSDTVIGGIKGDEFGKLFFWHMAQRKNFGAGLASCAVRAVMNDMPVTTKSLFQYGIIALPIAFAGFPLYVLAPDFYATHHGLSLTLLGALLLSIRLFDAVQDPVIGWLTDRLREKFLTLVIFAAILLCLSIFGLFNKIFFSPAIWFALCMFLAATAYSVLTITVGAQATLWTADKSDQTRIAGVREACGLVGLVIAVSMPSILSHMTSPNHVFLWYAAILTILMMIGVTGFSHVLHNLSLVETAKQKNPVSLLSGLRALSRDSIRLFSVYAVSMLASSVPAVLVIFYVRDLLHAENLTGGFLLLYFLSGVAGVPVWKKLSERFGKYKAWCFSNVLAVTGFIAAFFLGAGDVWPYAMVCIASGIALGADLTLPPSILADNINALSNERYAGTHYAFLAFIAKASLALASVIAFPALDAAGFKPQTVNSESSLLVLSAAYAVIPCVLKLVSAAMIYIFYTRTRSGGNDETIQNAGRYSNNSNA